MWAVTRRIPFFSKRVERAVQMTGAASAGISVFPGQSAGAEAALAPGLVASGWHGCRWMISTIGKAQPFHGARQELTFDVLGPLVFHIWMDTQHARQKLGAQPRD
jgi:hypothetical protein